MKKCNTILSVFLFLLTYQTVLGQKCVVDANSYEHIIQLSHINDINGLPQNSVKGIWKDGLGYIWIGTEQGLVRYDGANFITLTKQFKNSERVLFFVVDFDLKSLYVLNEYREVLKIERGRSLYLGLDDRYKNKGAFTKLLLNVEHVNSFSIIGNNELRFYGKQSNSAQRAIIWQKSDQTQSIPLESYHDVFSFGERDYILNSNFEVETFDPNNRNQIHSDIEFIGFTYDSFYRMFTYKKNLYLLQKNAQGFNIRLVQNNIDQLNELSSFYYDEHSRLLYIGTKSNGLFIYKVNAGVYSPKLLEKQSFYSQVLMDDNTVLLKDYTFSKNTFRKFNFPYQINHFTTLIDHHRTVFVPTFDKGVFRFDQQSPFQNLQLVFAEKDLEYIQEDHLNRIWLADKQTGLGIYDNGSESKITLIKRFEHLKILEGNMCYQTSKDRYVIFNNTTLYFINKKLELFDSLKFQNNIKVRFICTLNGVNGVFLLTYGNGIYYVSDKKKILQLPLDDNHYMSFSHGLFTDDHNRIWVTTNKGLFSIANSELLNFINGKQNSLLFYHIDHTSGLHTNEFNGGCYPTFLKLNDGYFSLPTITGITMVKPEELIAPPINSGIIIDKIKQKNNELTDEKHLVFKEGNVDLKINFSVVYWGNRENIEFEYQILGLDSTWKKIKNPYILEFKYLPYGDYTLNVRVRDKLFDTSVYYKSISLEVMPLFYHTWWFLVLMAILLALVVILIVKVRNRKILALNRSLEDMVAERTMKLVKQNKTINDNLDILKRKQELLNQSLVIKNRTLSVFSHNIVGPLKFISVVLNDAINNKNIDLSNIEALDKTAKSLLIHSKELLEWTKMQEEKIVVNWEEIDVLEFVNVKLRLVEFLLKSANINTSISVPDGLKIKTDSVILNIIIFNLMDNTIKYAPNSTMYIEFKLNNKSVCFKFKDTGPGMNNDTKHHINKLNLDVIRQKEPQSNSIGWFIISECVFLLNGEYKIKEESSKGFEVDFEFPLV